ncbi:MAG: ABC transporter permease [Chitinophagaceae bacterium]|nr:ABC transporter permease [Chitinophagaceae bacterium]
MKFQDIISLARKAIRSNRLRSNLTIAIIAIGITALIGIITIIKVLEGTIHSSFSSMGSNTFSISAHSFFSKGGRHGRQKRLRNKEEDQVIKLSDANRFCETYQYPAITSLSLVATNSATVKHQTKKTNPNIIVMGTDEHYLTVSGTLLEAGRNFNQLDVNSGVNTCILGNAIAKQLFGKAVSAVNGLISIGDARYRVLGVMESKGASFINRTDNMVLVSLANARQRFAIANKSCVISIHLADLKYMDYAIEEAVGTMRGVRQLKSYEADNFAINKNDEIANSLIENLGFVALAASLIGFITLLGAAIGLMNIMLVSVAERTREIGLSKAVGATNQTIRWQFLSESVVISLTGGCIGILVGILIGNILSLAFGSAFIIPWGWIALGLSICVVVGLLAGIYPALKAARLNPINALRYE